MRTTLTIDDDLAEALRALSRQRATSFKLVLNEVLRRGLSAGEAPGRSQEPFRVASAARGFRPGIDPLKLNQLVDELETERFLAGDHNGAPGQ